MAKPEEYFIPLSPTPLGICRLTLEATSNVIEAKPDE